MKSIAAISCTIILFALPSLAQQDTLIYDSNTGNYIIRYMRENPQTGERDSLVEVIFVPATKLNPSITAAVVFDADSNMFLYKYRIANGADSRQNLLILLIQFGRGIDVVEKSTVGWRGGRHRGFPEEELNRIWSWHGNQGLQPTWKKDGFALGSTGIPGIGSAYFQGNAPIEVYEHGLPPYELLKQIGRLKIFPADHVARPTIVPVAPPSPFLQLVFLDTLLSYTRQSVQLGWLKTTRDDDCDEDEQPHDGIARNIEKRIEKAKKELTKGDSAKARRELEKLVKKVEKIFKKSEELENAALRHPVEREKKREHEITMTSEAYALLKYNAEYLIERLPEKKKKGGKDR